MPGIDDALAKMSVEGLNKFTAGDQPVEDGNFPVDDPTAPGGTPEPDDDAAPAEGGEGGDSGSAPGDSDSPPQEPPAIEVDGEKFTEKEIRELRVAAKKALTLEQEMSEATTERERLAVWKQMDSLAAKYPALREKLAAVFSEFEQNADALTQPIEGKEMSDEEKLRAAWIDQQMVKEAGAEIDNLVKAAAEKFPNVVQFTDGWMTDTLLPAVVERFGNSAGIREIRMTLNDLIVQGGGLEAAAKNGAAKLAERLAKEPKGTKIIPGPTPRSAADNPLPNVKGKNIDEMFKAFPSDKLFA